MSGPGLEAPVQNVDGLVTETHSHEWSHNVSWSVDVSYVLLAAGLVVLAWVLYGALSEPEVSEESQHTPSSDGSSGLT